MTKNAFTATMLIGLLLCALLAPVCAFAQEATASNVAKEACLAAGGELLDAPVFMTVISPYGTPSVVLRDAPSDSYNALAMLTVGEEITALGTSGEFYFVLMTDDITGWLAADELLAQE